MSPKIEFEVKPPRDPEVLAQNREERLQRRRKAVKGKQRRTQDYLANQRLDAWEDSVPRKSLSHHFDEVPKNRWAGNLSAIQAKKLSSWVQTPRGFVILSGGEGVGKTTLAVAMVSQILLDQGETITRAPIFAPFNRTMSDISFAGSDLPALMDGLSDADILLLDDLGAANESMSAHQRKALWAIIDGRWSNGLPTIFTTNMSLHSNEEGVGMQAVLGESAWARMIDDVLHIDMDGRSLRSKV